MFSIGSGMSESDLRGGYGDKDVFTDNSIKGRRCE